jgi:hypothetical protein
MISTSGNFATSALSAPISNYLAANLLFALNVGPYHHNAYSPTIHPAQRPPRMLIPRPTPKFPNRGRAK